MLPVVLAVTVGVVPACGGEYTPSAGGRAGPGDPTTTSPETTPQPEITSSTPTAPPPTSTGPKPKPKPTTPTPPSPKPQPHVDSDDVGRSFDLGVIVGIGNEKGVPVIVLDRWTAKGVADSTIASAGYPLAPHSGTPFYNINTQSTYRIPVARGATFTYQHCNDITEPMVTERSTLRRMADLDRAEQVVLVTLDREGRATAVANDPAC
ncbi:hypothetical protein [Segeticoccus rhizosphaerae]|uniref:hypothetical protein n=1 Tax=Segeticoccus rhizosphaerae TaxID=1104777 RepID=UPI0010C0EBA4|nr:hypothetical protein [Ornithinicoccus soli]